VNAGIKVFVGLAAAVLIVVGLWLGFSAHSFDGRSCGSAFDPEDDSAYDAGRELGAMMSGNSEYTSATDGCNDQLDGLVAPAAGLIVIGVFGSAVWFWREPQKA